jgi:hypothetical protein
VVLLAVATRVLAKPVCVCSSSSIAFAAGYRAMCVPDLSSTLPAATLNGGPAIWYISGLLWQQTSMCAFSYNQRILFIATAKATVRVSFACLPHGCVQIKDHQPRHNRWHAHVRRRRSHTNATIAASGSSA